MNIYRQRLLIYALVPRLFSKEYSKSRSEFQQEFNHLYKKIPQILDF